MSGGVLTLEPGVSPEMLERLRSWHKSQGDVCVAELLFGVPESAHRVMWEEMIQIAFMSGVMAQQSNPMP